MMPVPGLEQVRVAWVLLQHEGYQIFGFMLYTNSDRSLVDYMKDGVCDLDVLSGDQCAIFAVESPSAEWIAYTQRNGHAWWRIYGKELIKQYPAQPTAFRSKANNRLTLASETVIENNEHCIIVVGDGNILLQQLLNPEVTLLFNRAEAIRIARHFNVEPNELPCLIFFKDLNSNVIWKLPLGVLQTQVEIKNFFRNFFVSESFQSLIR